MMRTAEYSFKTPLNYHQVFSLLRARYPGQWSEGDSAWHGDYMAAGMPFTGKDKGVLRIYHTGAFYLKLKLYCEDGEHNASACWDRLHAFAMDELVPLIQASALQPSSEID